MYSREIYIYIYTYIVSCRHLRDCFILRNCIFSTVFVFQSWTEVFIDRPFARRGAAEFYDTFYASFEKLARWKGNIGSTISVKIANTVLNRGLQRKSSFQTADRKFKNLNRNFSLICYYPSAKKSSF